MYCNTNVQWFCFFCYRDEDEQNVVAFQYKGMIYYKAYKDIKHGRELLVWYGSQYAATLGIPTEYCKEEEEVKPIKKNTKPKDDLGKIFKIIF